MKLVRVIAALTAISASVAFAGKDGGTPNCEVKGKKVHVKDAAACEKKKGKWLEETAAAPAAAPAEAPAAAPATGDHK